MGTGSKAETLIQKDIDKIIKVYSSITDEDVEALEVSDFFKVVKFGGEYYPDDEDELSTAHAILLEKLSELYESMREVEPLIAAFKARQMTDVETLARRLALWAKNDSELALDTGVEAAAALVSLLKIVRKNYQLYLSKSEAGPDDPLGRIAFAPAREGIPHEPNTRLEKKLGKAIEDHFMGFKLLSPEMAQLLRELMAQGLYSSMFAEPTVGVVYRGMNVEGRGVAWLKKMAGGELRGKKGVIDVNMKYKPKRGAASWTTEKYVTEEFFSTNADYHIIMYARVKDNPGMFLSAEAGLYNTDFAARFAGEREAIGLGTIRVFRIEWFSNEYM